MQPFNKYYPPDWTPEKGSVNKFVGKHPLGDRARKIDQGILVVRFELPFNIWCTSCNNHVGKGVRYNAEKKKIGNYYSTPIWQFRMRCHLCSHWIEIHTDPKNTEFVVIDGAKRKVEEWKEEDTEVIKLQDQETKEKLESDPIYRLEHGVKDKQVEKESLPKLTQLQHLQESQWSDPYARSQQLRRKFREQKKLDKLENDETEKLRDKHSLHIPLLPESSNDRLEAKKVDYSDPNEIEQRKLEKSVSGLFSKTSTKKNTATLSSSTTTTSNAARDLRDRAAMRTRLKTDPFLQQSSSGSSTGLFRKKNDESKLNNVMVRPNKKIRIDKDNDQEGNKNTNNKPSSSNGLVSYASSSSSDDDEDDEG
ncbi:CWC16 protein [Phascolomyces articulosus]|uniref:CWC16 protein n=1 Tax=Phascolomyces articulosus TaxID=60185 RepID=A0AAD5JMV1_9FUNG|nr:CWC16 protein [Phascolomyces articulosus]